MEEFKNKQIEATKNLVDKGVTSTKGLVDKGVTSTKGFVGRKVNEAMNFIQQLALVTLGVLLIFGLFKYFVFSGKVEPISPFRNIEIEADAIALKISRGDKFHLDIERDKDDNILSYEVLDDTLYIDHEVASKKFFSWFGSDAETYVYNIEIFIPEETDLGDINIIARNVATIEIDDVLTNQLNITTHIGAIEFKGEVISDTNITTNIGAVVIEGTLNGTTNIDTEMATIEITGEVNGETTLNSNKGTILINGSIDGQTDINNILGAVEITGKLSGDMNINTEFGAILIDTPQNRYDLDYHLSSLIPAIYLNETSVGTSYNTFDAEAIATLNINVEKGSIEISTK
ncbi:MAG: hypothetical protein ATN36_08250 [Epulopiscium sp. Nele67-Bin005]|nr:MAG: hypothetical protein ATN36_08250 [Epulopiscium sp. Nele67-Bin005]